MLQKPDFAAHVHILTPEEGGRLKPVLQGYRPTWRYNDDEPDVGWDIWAKFVDDDGNELPDVTPISQDSEAIFYILNDKLGNTVHRARLKEGVRFHMCEGSQIIAVGHVTKVFILDSDKA